MGTKRPPRLRKFDYLGFYRYFLTICTEARYRAFPIDDASRALVTQFLQAAKPAGFTVIAYCLMPDHLHALISGTRADANLRHFIRQWKQQTGFEWKQRTGKHLWQEGYYDRVLRPEESDIFVVAYMAANPVRAGLAETPEEYPLFESFVHSMDEIRKALEEIGEEPPWSRS